MNENIPLNLTDSMSCIFSLYVSLYLIFVLSNVIKPQTDLIFLANPFSLYHVFLRQKPSLSLVADSLPKLIELMIKWDINPYEEYFLLIDEIDAIQNDSGFRKRMGNCIDHYKMFKKEHRAMISATLMEFSDEILQNEPLTTYQYMNVKKGKINFLPCYDIISVGYDKIVEILKSDKEKIVVAHLSLKNCYSLAENLVQNNALRKEDIRILCGNNSENKNKMGVYFHELNELDKNKFPVRLNFTTAAYFNGFDINENYHLIVLSDCRKDYRDTSLSENTIIQIMGRCRTEGLISRNIIYRCPSTPIEVKYDKDSLIKASQSILDALKCIALNFSSNEYLLTL